MARKRIVKTKELQTALAAGTNAPATSVAYGLKLTRERPSSLNQVFEQCRKLSKESHFLSAYLPLKVSFYNYGFTPTAGPLAKGNAATELEEWLSEEVSTDVEYTNPQRPTEKIKVELLATNRELIQQFAHDLWYEWLLLDNAVPFWIDDDSPMPTLLMPEKCRFEDKFGIPILYYTHGLSRQETALLPDEQRKRFDAQGEILLDAESGEHFKVIKRGPVGSGFVTPRLYAAAMAFGEAESKETGLHALAFLLRCATRQHKLGHEITNGPHAGKNLHFWKKERALEVLRQFEKRTGPHEFTSNFDHEISYPWADPKVFDDVVFKGTNRRLAEWGGPIAQMLLAEKVVDGALGFLRAEVTEDRQLIANVLNTVIRKKFNPPENLDVRVAWSDLIFNDPKQAAELLKFAMQSGAASVTTVRKWIGLRPEEEEANKVKEIDDPDYQKKLLPAFDMSHGTTPATGMLNDPAKASAGVGPDSGKTNGRPVGSSNE